MTAGHPAERLLALAGAADAIGDGGAAQVAFGDAGRGDAIARRVEHRGAVDLAEHKHRAQGMLHRVHVALVQRITHRHADGTASQIENSLKAMVLEMAALDKFESDVQGGEMWVGQYTER